MLLARLPEGSRRQRKKLAQVARLQASGQLHLPGANEDPLQEFDAALAAFGLQPDDASSDQPEDKCYLWPCNLPTFNLWQRLQTQWRVGGMGSATGLDYAAVSAYLREVAGIKARALPEIFSALQAMEQASLQEWAKQRD